MGALVVGRLQRPDAAELLVNHARPDAGKLREEAVAIRTRIDTAAGDHAADVITRSQFLVMNQRLRERLVAVEADLADAGRVDLLGPLVRAEDVASVWGALTASRKRSVIFLLMTIHLDGPGRGARTFRPETVRIGWK